MDSVTVSESETGFQSTHPRGVRLSGTILSCLIIVVSIHAPTRGATTKNIPPGYNTYVSIHAPTRGATRFTASHSNGNRFNPRTHEGCDIARNNLLTKDWVSIHAPTRGATTWERKFNERWANVSIHAPTRGATRPRLRTHQGDRRFNPRTHEGCDLRRRWAWCHRHRFNPRTHEGCDTAYTANHMQAYVSIHAPTRGATAYSAKG